MPGEFRVNSIPEEHQWQAEIWLDDQTGEFAVAWVSDGLDGMGSDVFLRRFLRGGAPRAPEENVYGGGPESYHTRPRIDGAGGRVVVAWRHANTDADVYARVFPPYGPPTSTIPIGAHTDGRQIVGGVAMQEDGDFLVVWAGDGPDGAGVFGAFHAADGTPIDAQFPLASDADAGDDLPFVARDAAGGFVVGWFRPSESGPSIWLRRYDSQALPLAPEQHLTDAPTASVAHVALQPDGTGVVAFYDEDDDGNGVAVQAFGSHLAPRGPTRHVPEVTAQNQNLSSLIALHDGYLVGWTRVDTPGSGISRRELELDGTPRGREIFLRQPGNVFLGSLALAVDEGRVLGVWQSNAGGEYDLFGAYLPEFYDGFESGDLTSWTSSSP